MRKTLLQTSARDLVLERLHRLHPQAQRRWGSMSIGGMLCHLNDSYTGLLQASGTATEPNAPWAARYLLRPLAFHVPVRWPHGLPTVPDVNQNIGGTPPGVFEADRQAVIESLTRFANVRDFDRKIHPLFGPMSEWEWMRWGYLHADHHLRQFSS